MRQPDSADEAKLGHTVRFGVFEVELSSGELRSRGIEVKIQELPFRALTLLLSRPNQVLSRNDFRQVLWPGDVYVDFDSGVVTAIKRLRDTLGDSAANPIFIETVGRRGYRWIAPIHRPAVAPPPEDSQPVHSVSPTPAKPFAWGWLVYALPVLALLFAVWILRLGHHGANAGSNPPTATANGFHHAANRDAEEYYLKGRFYWNKRTPESLNLAVDSFTQAIVHDPAYSDAYVGLADCYNLLREFSTMPAGEAYPRAFAAAKKAVELDDRSSAAHASLAFVSFFGMWDPGSADREFRRALQLDPNNANAHHWYATFLQAVRRFDESLVEIDRAQALDPNSASILADKGRLLWVAGRHEEALRLLRQLEQVDPQSISPHRYLRLAYMETGAYPDYVSELKQEASLLHNPSLSAVAQAAEKGFAANGNRGMLVTQLEQQRQAYNQGQLSAYFPAETSALLGNTQDALRYLQACYEQHDDEIVNLAVDPNLKILHPLPAFQQLLPRVGLPPIE